MLIWSRRILPKQLEGKISLSPCDEKIITSTMRLGAEGIKIVCSGRLGGAEMARKEEYKQGRIPLHTLRADIDYATYTSHTTLWLYRCKSLDL